MIPIAPLLIAAWLLCLWSQEVFSKAKPESQTNCQAKKKGPGKKLVIYLEDEERPGV